MPIFEDGELGSSVRSKINAAITTVDELEAQGGNKVAVYVDRASFVSAIDGGLSVDDGTVASDGTVLYVASAGATAIADMPGWSPYGETNALHFGTNSGSDYSATVQAACDYVSSIGGGVVRLSKDHGPYVLSEVTVPSGVHVDLDGSDVQIDDLSAGNVFLLSGTLGTQVSLTANANPGDTTLTLSSTSGMASGDYLILRDNVSYTSTDATYKNGETVRVVSVDSSTQVTIVGSVLGTVDAGAYTTANSANVVPMLTATGGVSNGNFSGDSASLRNLIRFKYAADPVATGIKVSGHGNSAIIFEACVNPVAKGNSIHRLTDNIGGGQAGYGVVFAGACRGGLVADNVFSECRHAFTTIGNEYGLPRQFAVVNNQDAASSVASFDTHASGTDYEISNNLSVGSSGSGVTFRGPRARISGNTVIRSKSDGIRGREENIRDVEVSDNVLIDIATLGITVEPECPGLSVTRNVVKRCGNRGIRLFSTTASPVTGLVVKDNRVESPSQSASVEAIVVDGGGATDGLIMGNVVIQGSGSPTYGIRAFNLGSAPVVNNVFSGTFSTAEVSGGGLQHGNFNVSSYPAVNGSSFSINGTSGVSGNFTTTDGKTVTVTSGIVTSIV